MPTRAAVALLQLLPDSVARLLLTRHAPSDISTRLDFLATAIRDTVAEPTAGVSFYVGSPGPNQKLTAQVTRGGHVIAYVKIASSLDARRSLDSESSTLRRLKALDLKNIQVPSVLAEEDRGHHRLLFLSTPQARMRYRPLSPDNHDVAFLTLLMSLNRQCSRIAASNVPSAPGTSAHGRNPPAARSLALRLLETEEGLQTWMAHGDYAPWNTAWLGAGGLYVFDWEFANFEGPAFFDVFHRIFMPGYLISHKPPPGLVNELLDIRAHPLLGRLVRSAGTSDTALRAYLLLYLTSLIERERRSTGHVANYLSQCLEWAIQRSKP